MRDKRTHSMNYSNPMLDVSARSTFLERLWPGQRVSVLSLQETIARASIYFVGIGGLYGLTYLCLVVSGFPHR